MRSITNINFSLFFIDFVITKKKKHLDFVPKKTKNKKNCSNLAELLSVAHSEPAHQQQQHAYQPPSAQQPPQSQAVTKHVHAPIDRPISNNNGGLPAGQNICADCERLIV